MSPFDTLGVQKQRMHGSHKMLICSKRFQQTVSSDADFHVGNAELKMCRSLLTTAAIHGNIMAFGDCHSACHQSPMPSEAEPVYVEPVLETQVGLFQCFFLARMLCKVSRFRARVGVFTFTAQRINGMGNDQVVSGVAKRTQREDESTLCVTWMTWLAQHEKNIW